MRQWYSFCLFCCFTSQSTFFSLLSYLVDPAPRSNIHYILLRASTKQLTKCLAQGRNTTTPPAASIEPFDPSLPTEPLRSVCYILKQCQSVKTLMRSCISPVPVLFATIKCIDFNGLKIITDHQHYVCIKLDAKFLQTFLEYALSKNINSFV